jgi:putative membrane-bound dehydrogenase-like protein
VAIAFDASGRMFVAEMMDYPLGAEGGQIRCLEDRDEDGRFETATVFATKLPYPNGVLPWNGGVLVTAAPDVLFLKDTDGDNRADERRVILTGFGKGNQQLRVNGLMWGLDNWVYGANGRSDGEVRGLSLRGHDFRFRPATGEFETLAGRSQFGLARDEWGNRFLSWNTIAVRHEVIPERYLLRHPRFSGTEGVFDIAEPGDSGEVFPLTPAPLTFNKESTSHFNALAGLTIYRGDAYVGETLRNLVHRRRLIPDGPTFVARRVEQGKEFLASTDPWFHPVNFANGPDGALYMVDFYRQFVEHPHYVPEKLRDSQPWRTGAEHGRIWRIVNASEKIRRARPKLDQAPAPELVAHLKNANPWWRDTAQRLLVERRAGEAVPALKSLVLETNPIPAIHALWILEELGAVDKKLLAQANHTREHAVRIAERHAFVPNMRGDPRLDLQVILSLGQIEGADVLDRFAQFALEYSESRWHALALLSSVARWPNGFVRKLAGTPILRSPTDRQKEFLQQLAPILSWSLPEDASVIARLALGATNLAAEARGIADDPNASVTDRLIAIRALKGADLLHVLEPGQPPKVQEAAIDAMIPSRVNDLLGNWEQWSPRTRKLILSRAVRGAASAVIDALEKERVRISELDPASREALRKAGGARVEKLLAFNRDRDQVVSRFEGSLKVAGDATKGRALFEAKCQMCHGTNIGPNLAGMSARPKEALLADILDPSRQVSPDFAAYTVVAKDGDPISGLIVAENESSLTIRRPNEADIALARDRIREIRADGKSLMPDGLEEGLTVQDLADLLAFLAMGQFRQ